MAARRHARKVANRRGTTGAAIVFLAAGLGPTLPLWAATTEYIVVDRNSGLAIHGFDPVAYFTSGGPSVGKGAFEYRHAGAVWRFRNSGNLSAFANDPQIYMPRFGGYDPVAVGRGVAAAGDPRIWLIVGERLYLFHSPQNKAAFLANSEQAIATADETWPTVQRTLVP